MAPQYDVSDGRILTWALETHVVEHCNLRCANCCTLSPELPSWWVDPDELRRDLERAAGALRPHVFKLTGGEPLLHPELLRCLDAARASGGFRTDLGWGCVMIPGEDTDMMLRLEARGGRLAYVPDATVDHHIAFERCNRRRRPPPLKRRRCSRRSGRPSGGCPPGPSVPCLAAWTRAWCWRS